MAVTIFDAAEYGDLQPIGPKGLEGAAAVVKDGATVNVKFKLFDGAWPAGAVQVGTMTTSKPIALVVLATGELEIFDGTQVLFRSTNGGRSWVTG